MKPMMAGLAGAAVGAVAGAALASNETREKITKALGNIKDQTIETYHQVEGNIKLPEIKSKKRASK